MKYQSQSKDNKSLSKTKFEKYLRAESHLISRETIASIFLLRWIDFVEATNETNSLRQKKTVISRLPSELRWNSLCKISFSESDQLAKRLVSLSEYLKSESGDIGNWQAGWLAIFATLFERLSKVNSTYLLHELQRVAQLPFESSSDHLKALEAFDRDLEDLRDSYFNEHITPVNIAGLIAALADPKDGDRVCDPCYGSANLLIELNKRLRAKQQAPVENIAQLNVTGFEINDVSFLVGLVRMLLAGINLPEVANVNCFELEQIRNTFSENFDLVVSNPPIGVRVQRENPLFKHFCIQSSDCTGYFIQHALNLLKPGGRAVIVLPEGFLFRKGADRELRRHLLQNGQIEAVIGLPAGALLPTTSVSICLLVLKKDGGIKKVKLARINYENFKFNGSSLNSFDVETALSALNYPDAWEDGSVNNLRLTFKKLKKQIPQVSEMKEADKLILLERLNPFFEKTNRLASKDSLYRNVWEVDLNELEKYDWDLTPRRREKGGLDLILSNLVGGDGLRSEVVKLSSVADVISGRSIKSADLVDDKPIENAVGYVRAKDLSLRKVLRTKSWLLPGVDAIEKKWALLQGDVLIPKAGFLGKSSIISCEESELIASHGIYVLRSDKNRLDPSFLHAYLASSACQNWLVALSRGTVVQQISRSVLEDLPIPLLPLSLQVKAATEFNEQGTDVLNFLGSQVPHSNSDRITSLLADLDNKVPRIFSGVDETPSLTRFEPIVEIMKVARSWENHADLNISTPLWLISLIQALLPLSGASQIPSGPGLLSVLQAAERGVKIAIEKTNTHHFLESQARAICERLLEWLLALISDLLSSNVLQVVSSPASIVAGSSSEFSLKIRNPGVLPLRDIFVETLPNWGAINLPYLPENGIFDINLTGDTAKYEHEVSIIIIWRALTISGQSVQGEIELAIRVKSPNSQKTTLSVELGGSPYVTGDPLGPEHGQSVFYGREEIIGRISRQIETHGNVVLLEGNRRAGKTSILKHLEGKLVIPGWLAVYASLQGAKGASQVVGVPTAEVFREIAHSIAAALIKLGLDVPLPNGKIHLKGMPPVGVARACREGISLDSPFADFREYLQIVLSLLEPLELGLVLMLDEFDKLQEGIDNGVTSPQVPENIRFLIQTYPKFSAILTGSRRLKRLREEYWSALYGLGTSIPVTALDMHSARQVVTEPVRDQLAFSNEAVERVLEITARQPYLMQCLCNRIFDYAVQSKNRSITVSVVNDAAQLLVRDNEHFASLWDYASLGPETGRHRRQQILLICARGFKQSFQIRFGTMLEQLAQLGIHVEDSLLDIDLSYLRELELIDFAGEIGEGEYRLAIPLMSDWIEQQQDADVVASRARNESEQENG
jgi:type I restriction enzyme M protein